MTEIAPRFANRKRSLTLGHVVCGAGVLALAALLDRKPPQTPCEGDSLEGEGRTAAATALDAAPDQGRDADAPSEFPVKGWKQILRRVVQQVGEDRIPLISAGVAFYAILAIFPAIAAMVSIYSLVADPSAINQHINDLRGIMPDGALAIIGGQVSHLAAKPNAVGLTAAASLLLSLWSANGGLKAVFDALNIVYEEREKRSFLKLNFASLVFTFAALLFVALALGAIVVTPIALKFLGLDDEAASLALLRWPALLLIVIFGLATLYRFGPSRNQPKWRWVSWGSSVAALLWIVVSSLFSWYVAHFGSYNETYGSLGAAIGFMTWIWISTMIVLLGAELNAEMERQTARDSTIGQPKPLGSRRAHMADTLAASSTNGAP